MLSWGYVRTYISCERNIYFVNVRHTTSLALICNFIIRSSKISIKRVKVGCDVTPLTIDYANRSGGYTYTPQ